jgi:hypothetical protein
VPLITLLRRELGVDLPVARAWIEKGPAVIATRWAFQAEPLAAQLRAIGAIVHTEAGDEDDLP